MQEASPILLLFIGTPTFMSTSPDRCWYFHCENKYRRQNSEAIPWLAVFPTEMNEQKTEANVIALHVGFPPNNFWVHRPILTLFDRR